MVQRVRLKGYLTTADITDITGYPRTAFSGWRRRLDPVPEPAGRLGKTNIYREEDFLTWATRNNILTNRSLDDLAQIPVLPVT